MKQLTDEQLVELLLISGERAVREITEMFKDIKDKTFLVGAVSMYMSHLIKAFEVDPQLFNETISKRKANKAKERD
jgi:hypothetical protein